MNRLHNPTAAPEAAHFEEIARRADGLPARADAGLATPAQAMASMNILALDISRLAQPAQDRQKHKKNKSKKNKPRK